MSSSHEKLTKEAIIRIFNEKYGLDISSGLRMKVVDHLNNKVAPERYCYKISYNHPWLQKRESVSYWPNTVGIQG